MERRFATARELRQAVEAVYKRVQGKGQRPPEADPARPGAGVEAPAQSAKQRTAQEEWSSWERRVGLAGKAEPQPRKPWQPGDKERRT